MAGRWIIRSGGGGGSGTGGMGLPAGAATGGLY
jgi:hypothetical protein